MGLVSLSTVEVLTLADVVEEEVEGTLAPPKASKMPENEASTN